MGVSYHGKLHTSYNGPDGIKGCSVDVFKSAISLLPYPVGCIFLFRDGLKNPRYGDLVQKVSKNVSNMSISSSLKNYRTIFILILFNCSYKTSLDQLQF